MQTSNFIGELLGTLVLILLGDGVVANILLKGSKGENGGWLVVTTAWAFAVMCGVFVAQKFGSPDAHLNPAITIAMAVKSGDWSNVAPFIAAQMIVNRTNAGVDEIVAVRDSLRIKNDPTTMKMFEESQKEIK